MQLRQKSVLAAATATLALVTAGQAGAVGPWEPVGDDVKSGVSGLALTGHSDGTVQALIVRDNKKPGDNRIANSRTPRANPPQQTSPLSPGTVRSRSTWRPSKRCRERPANMWPWPAGGWSTTSS